MTIELPPRWRAVVTRADDSMMEALLGWWPGARLNLFEIGWWPLTSLEDDELPHVGCFRLELIGGGRVELAVFEREAFPFVGGSAEARARAVVDAWLRGAGLGATEGLPVWSTTPLEGLPRDGSWSVRGVEIEAHLAQLLSDRLGAIFLCLPRALAGA